METIFYLALGSADFVIDAKLRISNSRVTGVWIGLAMLSWLPRLQLVRIGRV